MLSNKMKHNPDKMEILLVGPHSILGSGITQMLDGVALPLKAHIHSLELLLDLVVCLGCSGGSGSQGC